MFEISGVGSCALCMFWYLSLSSDNGEGGCETWKCCTSIVGKNSPHLFQRFYRTQVSLGSGLWSSLNQAVCDWERFLRLNWYHYVTLVDEDINSIQLMIPGSLQGWAGIPVSRDSWEYKPQISLSFPWHFVISFPVPGKKEFFAGN